MSINFVICRRIRYPAFSTMNFSIAGIYSQYMVTSLWQKISWHSLSSLRHICKFKPGGDNEFCYRFDLEISVLFYRMSYLADIGLSKREIAFMVRRFSPLLGYSIQKVFTPKLDFLVNTMKKPLKEIVEYPRYFSYSLEKKIKPRYWVLRGRKLDCTLKDMLSKNDEEFAAEFMGIERMLIPPSHH